MTRLATSSKACYIGRARYPLDTLKPIENVNCFNDLCFQYADTSNVVMFIDRDRIVLLDRETDSFYSLRVMMDFFQYDAMVYGFYENILYTSWKHIRIHPNNSWEFVQQDVPFHLRPLKNENQAIEEGHVYRKFQADIDYDEPLVARDRPSNRHMYGVSIRAVAQGGHIRFLPTQHSVNVLTWLPKVLCRMIDEFLGLSPTFDWEAEKKRQQQRVVCALNFDVQLAQEQLACYERLLQTLREEITSHSLP